MCILLGIAKHKQTVLGTSFSQQTGYNKSIACRPFSSARERRSRVPTATACLLPVVLVENEIGVWRSRGRAMCPWEPRDLQGGLIVKRIQPMLYYHPLGRKYILILI